MTAIMAWNNYVKASTITSNNAVPGLSASNVAGDQGSPSAGWQTSFGSVTLATGALIRIEPATPGQTWRVIGLFGTNLTASAAVTAQLWNNPTTPVNVTQVTLPGPVPGFGQVVFILPHDYTADYLQMYFDDPTNPDGFINIPLVFAGPAWFPAGSTGFSSTVGRDDSTLEVTSRGGQEYPTLLWQRRRWNVAFDSLRVAEVWAQADTLNRYAKGGSNAFFAPDSASANLQREAIFGRLKATADVSYPYNGADRRRWSASISERL
jgi:hypothetical protein